MQLCDTWLRLVWRKFTLAIKSLFAFFNECTRIINSPSCYVLNFESHYFRLKVPWRSYGIFKVSFMNFPTLLYYYFFSVYVHMLFRIWLNKNFWNFPGVSSSKPSGGFKANSAFHPLEVKQMMTTNLWELSGKK